MVTVRIVDVRDDGGATVWRVTAPSIAEAKAMVPGQVEFPLREDEFFRGSGSGGFRSVDIIPGDGDEEAA